jgi:YD repeat-containing protein
VLQFHYPDSQVFYSNWLPVIHCRTEITPPYDNTGLWFWIVQGHPYQSCDGSVLAADWLELACADDEVVGDEITSSPQCVPNSNPPLEEKDLGDGRCQEYVGNPINVAAGNKYARETDYTALGTLLTFERHYNSLDSNDLALGPGWRHTFDRQVVVEGEHAYVAREDGQVRVFSSPPCSLCPKWIGAPDNNAQLIKTASGWEYRTPDEVTEYYSTSGQLVRIEDSQGRFLLLTYDGTGRLERVDSGLGPSLEFTYTGSSQLATVKDHTNRTWTYEVNMNGSVESVSRPDGTVRQYLYEDSRFPYALTGIMDARGLRYATFEYDANGRAKASYHGPQTGVLTDRIDGVSIVYHADSKRTVTNSRGTDSVYTTTNQLNASLVTDINGPGCASCGGSDTSYIYDPATNNLLSRTGNGITTEYGGYDANGNPGFMIEAKGTTEERRTDYIYDPRYISKIATLTEPSVYAGASKITTYTYDDYGNRTSETISGFDPDGNPVNRTTTYLYNGPLHQLSQIDGPARSTAPGPMTMISPPCTITRMIPKRAITGRG